MNSDTTHSSTPSEDRPDVKVYNTTQGHVQQNDEDVLIDIRSIFLMLWRRKYVIFGVVLIGMSLTIMILTTIRPQYTARSLVLVETKQQSNVPSELKLLVDNYVRFDSTLVMDEIELIRSRSMARKVIERLELLTDPEFNLVYRESLKEYAPELLNRKQTYKSFNVFKSELNSLPPRLLSIRSIQLLPVFYKIFPCALYRDLTPFKSSLFPPIRQKRLLLPMPQRIYI